MDVELQCRCGQIKGQIKQVSPSAVKQLVCYCEDCRKFARHLSSEGASLNQYGGSELVLAAPAKVEITEGKQQLACLRLTQKGIYRWYSQCCNTPIANTVSLKFPLVTVYQDFMPAEQVEKLVNQVEHLGAVNEHQALKPLPEALLGASPRKTKFKLIVKLLGWKLTGKGKPNPFYEDSGRAKVKPSILKS
ncbi:DUF6151 family protein [Agarivorans sp. Alg241-V36]|uniref:DUF6151 family protein n=1 Tax=Agarivorans sp. Alg241-V36 TaxID=2305992 RepID=UPI0013D6A9A4|nr:DUF6151 family protein [Agarivorans sp. Alg241-V36]